MHSMTPRPSAFHTEILSEAILSEAILSEAILNEEILNETVATVKPATAKLWAKQDQHEGDRWRLFSAVAEVIDATTVLYPGSFVDVAPSFVFGTVTYLDVDKRAAPFFADSEGVAEIIADHDGPPSARFTFIHDDYTNKLDLPAGPVDLLISLYAGFISEHCTQHLAVGGTLLVNASHGDAAMASIDPRYELFGVVVSRSGSYHVETNGLDSYLVPKKPTAITTSSLHESGRGIAYTKSPFAYLFTRVR